MLNNHRYCPSSVMIDKYDKLMVVGPSENKNCELYDINKNEWKFLTHSSYGRFGPGLYYDATQNKAYLGGGFSSYNKYTECYDFEKNIWHSQIIPITTFEHKWCPLIWMEDNNLLFISSIPGKVDDASPQSQEFIDLRECKKWNVVYSKDLLHEMFGVEFKLNEENYDLRLLQSM